jgi:hypothetical protein
MNRIILIGNGFDLAHGLKTSYKDFITNFWKSKGKEVIDNDKPHDCDFININKKVDGNPNDLKCFEDFLALNERYDVKVRFKNDLIKELSSNSHLKSFWVDIENEYYSRLKSISHKERKDDAKSELKKLHKEFDQIKKSLSEYLLRIEKTFDENSNSNPHNILRIKSSVKDIIQKPFSLKDLNNVFLKELSKRVNQMLKNSEEEIDNLKIDRNTIDNIIEGENTPEKVINIYNSEFVGSFIKLKPNHILLLNFNYTDTHLLYTKIKDYSANSFQGIQSIKIHGCINETNKNPIIFGFGDELDKDYQAIEDLDDNDYLENIKSIKYLETDNYRKLLEFAESDKFQICIFGHSCGNSDRTLLNTLFEHDNCVSIKPYYYINDNGEDNYSQITRNISRNFKSKAKMRERVVNKTYTETLT